MASLQIDTFEQAREYLRSFIDFEKRGFHRWEQEVVTLDPMRDLAERLGNPQDHLAIIHIAGTKGKGSTGAMLEAALRAAGLRTGFYCSPHLIDFGERIRLDGQPLSHERLTRLVREIQPAAEALHAQGTGRCPTFFEVYTALGFLAFAQANVDVAIIETGLGGRLDATNIVNPLLTIITTIGFDHTHILGETLGAIAGEKAGIIKPGVPLVSAPQAQEAREVILARAAALGAPAFEARAEFTLVDASRVPVPPPDAPFSPPVQRFCLRVGGRDLEVATPLLGAHQALNATVAYSAVERLRELGWEVEDEHFVTGLAGLRWPGRFDVREARPWLVLDVAHNDPSAAALAAALAQGLEFERLVLVLGISSDKDGAAIARRLTSLVDNVILTQARLARAMPAEELLAQTAGIWRAEPEIIPSVRRALDRARELAGVRDCICVAGSVFVAGEAAAYLEGLPEEY